MYKYKVQYKPIQLHWNPETQAYEADVTAIAWPTIQNIVVISDNDLAWGNMVAVQADYEEKMPEDALDQIAHIVDLPLKEVAPVD